MEYNFIGTDLTKRHFYDGANLNPNPDSMFWALRPFVVLGDPVENNDTLTFQAQHYGTFWNGTFFLETRDLCFNSGENYISNAADENFCPWGV